MGQLKMVIAERLVRRLCSACKVGYAPDPNQLRKLNMDPAAVGKLYLARKEPMRDSKGNVVPCTFCHDLAFTGRFGVFEVFVIDDEVREVIRTGGSDAQLKQVFRKHQFRLLQEMALAHVQVGETSVEEVLRVLRGDGHKPAAPAAHR
jgi:type II secretory ATPase GspE/PulE/Tfp pilus assembly ATPase PilB-like protein